jgi:thioredoxin-dependent peroxiredoxin
LVLVVAITQDRVHNAAMRCQVILSAVVACVACKSDPASNSPTDGPSKSQAATGITLSQKSTSGLTVGEPAPDVTLALQNAKTVKLSELRGKAVVLYFYPKDDTPGCRVEAQGFRDLHPEFVAANVVVFGVSTQDEASHQAFIQKESLPFDLVIDRDGQLAAAFGVRMMGAVTSRQTVLVDSAGNLAAKWVDVTPATHAAEVLVAAKMPPMKTP